MTASWQSLRLQSSARARKRRWRPEVMRLEDRLTPYAVGLDGANPVHEYLTQIGYNVFARQFGDTDISALSNGVSQFVTGARDEDVSGAGPLGDSLPFGGHFWAHDVLYNRDLSDGLFLFESAPVRAERLLDFGDGIAATYATDKAEAFYRWGHVVHLLQDMTVPAHAHADPHFEHPLPEDPDPYHDWVDGVEFIDFAHVGTTTPDVNRIAGFYAPASLRYITYAAIADYDRQDLRRPDEITGQYLDPLTNLFYENARAADFYDTKDYVGRGNSNLLSDRGTLILVDTPLATGVRQFFPAANYDSFTFAELNDQAADLVPRAVKSTAEAIRFFFSLVDTDAPKVALPKLRSTDPTNPQAFPGGRIELLAAATDQHDATNNQGSDSGVGKDLFKFEYAVVSPDGSLGTWQELKTDGSGSFFRDGGGQFGPEFSGKHGTSARAGLDASTGSVFAVRASAEDGAGRRGTSDVYYVRTGEPAVTEITVIDRSGSMSGGPLMSAIASASAELGTRKDFDRIGVVSFSTTASVVFPLTTITPGSQVREQAQQSIAQLTAGGSTSIGAGLVAAVGMLNQNPLPEELRGQTSIVVLTDGMENSRPYISDVVDSIPGYVTVHGIALGSGADAPAVQKMARDRGGQFFAASDAGDLPSVYARVSGAISGEQDVARRSGKITVGSQQTFQFQVDASARSLTVGLTWPGSDLDLMVIAPDGQVFTHANPSGGRFTVGRTYEYFQLPAAMPGTWMAIVDAIDVAAGGEPFEAFARVATPITAEILTPTQTLAAGDSLSIRVRLTDGQPILGADLRAALIPPNHNTGPTVPIPLFDDGTHGDEVAGDGVYSNSTIVGALGRGVYTLQIQATGPGFVRSPSQLLLVTGSAPSNSSPVISDITDQILIMPATTVGPLIFSVGDAETAAESLIVTATSSNPDLIAPAAVVLGATGNFRTVTVSATPGRSGTAVIKLTVTDAGGKTASDSFTVTVAPARSRLARPADRSVLVDSGTIRVPLDISDPTKLAVDVPVNVVWNNHDLVNEGYVYITREGGQQILNIIPVAGRTGIVSFTLALTDHQPVDETASFTITLTASGSRTPVPPRITRTTLRRGRGKRIDALTVEFSAPMQPEGLSNPSAFRLISAGRDRRFGTRDDKQQALTLATPSSNPWQSLSLRPVAKRLDTNQPFRFLVDERLMRDQEGTGLDANGDRIAGEVVILEFGARAKGS